jgi:Pyruvate/2-oxoacid:ferredoxin oxidoreductase delta subunit
MAVREIIRIDENLCDGCGDCILSCAEGALQIVDGKARLVSDTLCDGFGNCLGACPQDAISIIKREAEDFDESAIKRNRNDADRTTTAAAPNQPSADPPANTSRPSSVTMVSSARHMAGGCPGSAMRMFPAEDKSSSVEEPASRSLPSQLTQWPVQLMLVPPTAPFLKGREILLAADCCPFAFADFHGTFLKGKALLVGCPKLDDLNFYRQKLEEIFRDSGCTGVTVMMMEVPCCGGLQWAAEQALRASGKSLPLREIIIGVRGNILRESTIT